MKNAKQKLNLSQETLKILAQPRSNSNELLVTNIPWCPTCSLALQTKADRQ
jgi:hypothetical protein